MLTLDPAPLGTAPAARPTTIEGLFAEIKVMREEVASLSATLGRRREPPAIGHASAPLTGLYATFFGTFTLYRDGNVVALGNARPVAELCRYMIARRGETVSCEELVELLWPEADPPRALHRLHVAASSLRRTVDGPGCSGSLLQFQEDGYAVSQDAVDTDFSHFEANFRLARGLQNRREYPGAAAAFRAALEVYTADYLTDRLYAEWAGQRRAHYSEQRLSAMTFLCEFAMLTGDFGGVLEFAQQILEADNLRERAHRDLMRAHYHLGQRACAVRQYRACAKILQSELGVEPSPLTTSLLEAIQASADLPAESPLMR